MKKPTTLTFHQFFLRSILFPLFLLGNYGYFGRRPIHPLSSLVALLLFLPIGKLLHRLEEEGKLNRVLDWSPMGAVFLLAGLIGLVSVFAARAVSWALGWLFFPAYVLWSLLILAYLHRNKQLKEEGESSDPPSPNAP